MSRLILIIHFLFISVLVQAAGVCQYDSKDYESAGFGIPHRSGFFIKGRFGCVYKCECPNGSKWKVTHVLEERHFDLAVMSEKTGGPSAAKWFICPMSVVPSTWKAHRDEIGHILYYSVDSNYKPFPATHMKNSPQFQKWTSESCGVR